MGMTMAIQTQCCLLKREEDDGDDGEPLQEETAVQFVEPVPWRFDGGPPGAPPRPRAAVPQSLPTAMTIPTQG